MIHKGAALRHPGIPCYVRRTFKQYETFGVLRADPWRAMHPTSKNLQLTSAMAGRARPPPRAVAHTAASAHIAVEPSSEELASLGAWSREYGFQMPYFNVVTGEEDEDATYPRFRI
jgi:hypothetical protein